MWAWLQVIEMAYGYTGRYFLRIATFLARFRQGKEEGYPTCCVAQFAWDMARRKPPAVRRGSIQRPGKDAYVPCWYHKDDPFWEAFSDTQPTVQLQLFKETRREARNRRRRERELAGRYSGGGFGRPHRQGG